jgi:hypothetical protein
LKLPTTDSTVDLRRDWQRADRGRLVDHEEDLTGFFELSNDLAKFGFVVG